MQLAWVWLILFFCSVPGAEAQTTIPRRPVIEGKVLSQRGRESIRSAMVTLVDKKGSARRTVITDSDGGFLFYDIPPGQYELTASHADFEPGGVTVDFAGDQELGLQIVLVEKRRPAPNSPSVSVPVWALQIPAKARSEYGKGMEEYRKGANQKSITYFQAAVAIYPQYAAAHTALGAAYLETGGREDAERAYENALKIDANLGDACLGLGALYLAQKRYDDAEKFLLRARGLQPDEWRIHHQLGEVYWGAGNWEKGEESLRRARALHGNSPRVRLLLINVLALQEKNTEALAEMEAFLQTFPRHEFAGKVREKRDLLKRHLSGNP